MKETPRTFRPAHPFGPPHLLPGLLSALLILLFTAPEGSAQAPTSPPGAATQTDQPPTEGAQASPTAPANTDHAAPDSAAGAPDPPSEAGLDALRERTLRIAIREAPPFVMDESGEWGGLSIALWEHLASELELRFELLPMSLVELLDAVEGGTVDAGVAAITITPERERLFDFTHPFFVTGTGIAVRYEERPVTTVIVQTLLSRDLLRAVFSLALLLLFIGALVFLFERKRNEDEFGGSLLEGLGAAFWWSAVTMTTVGYGDKSPRTPGGRLVALIWMFASIVLISVFTAAIASHLTLDRMRTSVSGPADLPRVSVGALAGSATEDWLRTSRIRHEGFPTLEAGLRALEDERIEAFVHDAPILQWQLRSGDFKDLTVLPQTFNRQYYAIALPAGSPLRTELNAHLIDYITTREWLDLRERLLGTDE